MSEFKMPTLGAEMESGRLVEWKVKPGDPVKRGDIVAVVDTDKAAVEVEIWEDGIVDQLIIEPGQKVPVGTVLAMIRSQASAKAAEAPKKAAVGAAPPAARAPTPVFPPPPMPERMPGGTRVSPAARKRAKELGVDLSKVQGTGPEGAITSADVERLAPPAHVLERERGEAMLATIAAAMARSKREIPHYYLSTQIDMGNALEWLTLENAKRALPDRILPTVLLLKAVARALKRIPELNGFWREGRFQRSDSIHIGVAISLREGGLIAPAIHDADKKTLDELMRSLQDLVNRARAGTLRSSELFDPTITVSSLPEESAEALYGVIYPPQVALVGLGSIVQRPWAMDGAVRVRPVLTATLSGDHRASNGARGALFLSTLARILQKPGAL